LDGKRRGVGVRLKEVDGTDEIEGDADTDGAFDSEG
jgi:hypothetical protein